VAAVQGTEVAAVVFDLDGVLLESEQVWLAAKRELTARTGGRWLARADRDMLGMSSPEWSAYMHERLAVPLAPQEISSSVLGLVLERYRHELPLLPGADHAVRTLARSWPLGLASSSNRAAIELVLDRAGWREEFAVTVSSEEVAHGKPAPDVYLAAVAALHASPGHCVAIEDSAAGISSASTAGLAVVAIPNRAFPPDAAHLRLAAVVLGAITQLDADTVRRAAARG
jgi:HAD superfamily hydrolase (TIGR01509 family)